MNLKILIENFLSRFKEKKLLFNSIKADIFASYYYHMPYFYTQYRKQLQCKYFLDIFFFHFPIILRKTQKNDLTKNHPQFSDLYYYYYVCKSCLSIYMFLLSFFCVQSQVQLVHYR